jgi:hypothetical protein
LILFIYAEKMKEEQTSCWFDRDLEIYWSLNLKCFGRTSMNTLNIANVIHWKEFIEFPINIVKIRTTKCIKCLLFYILYLTNNHYSVFLKHIKCWFHWIWIKLSIEYYFIYINHNLSKCTLSLYIYENKERKRLSSCYTLSYDYYY